MRLLSGLVLRNIVLRLSRKLKTIFLYLFCREWSGLSKPIYPDKSGSGLRIHLGAGPINIQGWVNIDACDGPHIHMQTSGFDLKEFSDGAVSEIYMCHVLEHFSFDEVTSLLHVVRKKLHSGGLLRLSVPDFDKLVAIYQANNNDLDLIKNALMGGQEYKYNFHKAVFNESALSDLLISCGFSNIKTWSAVEDFGVDLGDWSNKSFYTPSGEFAVSLNVKATFDG